MRGSRSFVLLLIVVLPGLGGCTTSASARHDGPRCVEVGCTEKIPFAAAGPGSSVVLVQCEGTVRTTRRYQLDAGRWTLQMYETGASEHCPTPASAR
jgi:hypothetical protein